MENTKIKRQVNLSITNAVFKEYMEFCYLNSLVPSWEVEKFMKEKIKEYKKVTK